MGLGIENLGLVLKIEIWVGDWDCGLRICIRDWDQRLGIRIGH